MKHTKRRVRLLAWMLALTFLLPFSAGALQDVADCNPLTDACKTVIDLNIMSKNGEDFRADANLTRQEMFRILYSVSVGGEAEPPDAFYAEKLKSFGSFTDVAQIAQWALPYAGYSVFNKFYVGDAQGALHPQTLVSYAECAAVLLRLIGLPDTELKGSTWAKNAVNYAQQCNLLAGISIRDVYEPISRADAAQMIVQAMRSACIAGVSAGSLRMSTETAYQRFFHVSDAAELIHTGVVTGKRTVGGRTWMTVSAQNRADREQLYPYEEALYVSCLGQPVRWTAQYDGTILTPMQRRTDTISYEAAADEITASGTQLKIAGQSVPIPAGSQTSLFLYDVSAGTVSRSNETSIQRFLENAAQTCQAQYGSNVPVTLLLNNDCVVLCIRPNTILRFDRSAYAGGIYRQQQTDYHTVGLFDRIPDGAVLSVRRDEAAKTLTLLSFLQPVPVDNGSLQAKKTGTGTWQFQLNGQTVENHTALLSAITDETLAAQYANRMQPQMERYVILDGDAIVAAGFFDKERLPYTSQRTYLLYHTARTVEIGGRTYTALSGYLNGSAACELIDGDFDRSFLTGGGLVRLAPEKNTHGEMAIRAYRVSSDASYPDYGRLEHSVDSAEKNRTIVVDGKTLTLSPDCRILCAESSGQVGQYQLSDLLIVNGRGYGMAASYAFSAVYGKNSQGQVEWLMILRSKW